MSADAIMKVSVAVRQRLEDALGGNSVYIGPLDDSGAMNRLMVLFLYRIAVSAELRNTHHVLPPSPADPAPVQTDRALPLELYFLLTAGNSESGGEPAALETLGRAIQVLNDSPNFTGVDLHGEVIRLTLDPLNSEEMSRIWALFPTANYRTSVIYRASPVWIYPALLPPGAAPVLKETYRVGQPTGNAT